MSSTTQIGARELDHRITDGIDVTLFWSPRTNRLWVVVEDTRDGQRWRVVIDGSCSFLSLPRLSKVLGSVPPASQVTVELDVDFLDHPVHDTLDAWRLRHVGNGGSVEIAESGTARLHDAQAGPPVRGHSSAERDGRVRSAERSG